MGKAKEVLLSLNESGKEVKKAKDFIMDALSELGDISDQESGGGGPIYKSMQKLREVLVDLDKVK